MGEYLKRAERSRATDDDVNAVELNFSKKRKLYCDLGNEYRGDLELPKNALSPVASSTSGCFKCDESIEVGRRSFRSPDLEDVDW
ncbi:hypothetical protein CDL12_26830 [Handroanthus impetiginosus]|uniref:Uncharacterized protein n=1 Tax=Handroanthus impetiginosus TaxID=429701 RepID=A0A2G9G5T7_9LAMI|nr:hypothetical protein CDL12_26830 [Handroanthus impetiginosus]